MLLEALDNILTFKFYDTTQFTVILNILIATELIDSSWRKICFGMH